MFSLTRTWLRHDLNGPPHQAAMRAHAPELMGEPMAAPNHRKTGLRGFLLLPLE